jgi:hypothetical protein
MGSLQCPECHNWYLDNRRLGLHRRMAHGVPGAHHHGKPKPRVKRIAGVEDKVVGWMREHPGSHHHSEVAEALGYIVGTDRVVKLMSSAKRHGQPITSDGHGNWSYVANLPAKAPVSPPEPPQTNGKVHFTSQRIVLLLTDTEGREWVAEPR